MGQIFEIGDPDTWPTMLDLFGERLDQVDSTCLFTPRLIDRCRSRPFSVSFPPKAHGSFTMSHSIPMFADLSPDDEIIVVETRNGETIGRRVIITSWLNWDTFLWKEV